MNQTHFDRPVSIRFGRVGKIRHIHTVWEALKCLANDKWPNRSGHIHEMTITALHRALRGDISAEDARQAFAQAARRSKILAEVDAQEDLALSAMSSISSASGLVSDDAVSGAR